jgi:membrane-associated phospholipid phosphatase
MPESLSMTVRMSVFCVGLTLWLVQYFIINNITQPPRPRIKSSIALDELIPFIPDFIIVYLSTYVFGILPFFLISGTSLFISTTMGYVIIATVSSTIHVLYPSQVQRYEIPEDKRISRWLISWFQRICRPYGNFPSTHVAFSVMSVSTGFIVGGPVFGGIFLTWAGMIALSTLVTKQHYLLDIVVGSALGAATALMVAVAP